MGGALDCKTDMFWGEIILLKVTGEKRTRFYLWFSLLGLLFRLLVFLTRYPCRTLRNMGSFVVEQL